MLSGVIAGALFSCTPVTVWDGDGPVKCAEGPKVRLRGVAAPEIDGTCRRNQPCPRANGTAARDHLVQLLGGAIGTTADGHVRVAGARLARVSFGQDDYRRTVAACRLPDGRELGCEQVRAGVALRWRKYGGVRLC